MSAYDQEFNCTFPGQPEGPEFTPHENYGSPSGKSASANKLIPFLAAAVLAALILPLCFSIQNIFSFSAELHYEVRLEDGYQETDILTYELYLGERMIQEGRIPYGTGKLDLKNLQPDTRYTVRIFCNGQLEKELNFRTKPAATSPPGDPDNPPKNTTPTGKPAVTTVATTVPETTTETTVETTEETTEETTTETTVYIPPIDDDDPPAPTTKPTTPPSEETDPTYETGPGIISPSVWIDAEHDPEAGTVTLFFGADDDSSVRTARYTITHTAGGTTTQVHTAKKAGEVSGIPLDFGANVFEVTAEFRMVDATTVVSTDSVRILGEHNSPSIDLSSLEAVYTEPYLSLSGQLSLGDADPDSIYAEVGLAGSYTRNALTFSGSNGTAMPFTLGANELFVSETDGIALEWCIWYSVDGADGYVQFTATPEIIFN